MSRAGSVLALVAAVSLVGCATEGAMTDASPEEIVMMRAQARWDAARAGDFEKSYSYTAPSYRAVTDIGVFRGQTAGSRELVSAKVISVKCEEESRCAAKVRIEYYMPLSAQHSKPQTINNHYDEPWVKEDGGWWLYQR